MSCEAIAENIFQQFKESTESILRFVDYIRGASNSRKCSWGSTIVKPLNDDAEFEDGCDK